MCDLAMPWVNSNMKYEACISYYYFVCMKFVYNKINSHFAKGKYRSFLKCSIT